VKKMSTHTNEQTITLIGSGTMAAAIGTRAASHGHTVEIMSRNSAKAQALADQIGAGATVGTYGDIPAGDIVIVAVPYGGVADAVSSFGDALAGKVLVDISNPFNADASGLVTSSSAAQEVADVAPASAHVVKAFNTIFGHVLAKGTPLDAFIAGDSAEAKATLGVFLDSLELRPLDAGGLPAAALLEQAGLLLMGLSRNGAGFDLALGAEVR
jgi:predicted dinucleotide-binding enzyme